MRYSYKEDGEIKGFYELNPFPSCNQLIVSNHAFIAPDYRGNGSGKRASRERIRKAIELGYDCMMCTCRADNHVQVKILKKAGWSFAWAFHSKETNRTIQVWFLNLGE
tara:strand:- start:7619 stop:7942 length:324 start_codon:yes stop_codon:yes gene_type:complete